MPIPESVKVTFKGKMKDYMDFRDVVHATQHQMLKKFNGEMGRLIYQRNDWIRVFQHSNR